jgi:hypothetical protein
MGRKKDDWTHHWVGNCRCVVVSGLGTEAGEIRVSSIFSHESWSRSLTLLSSAPSDPELADFLSYIARQRSRI